MAMIELPDALVEAIRAKAAAEELTLAEWLGRLVEEAPAPADTEESISPGEAAGRILDMQKKSRRTA